MDVLIIGAGAIGVAVGAMLGKTGCSVSFLARQNTKACIDRNGIQKTGLFGDIALSKAQVNTYLCYEDLPDAAFDFILICAKTMANEEISGQLAQHKRIFRPNSVILIMQNGWGNEADYLRYFSKEKIFHARVITGFERLSPNCSKITVHNAPVLIGSLYHADTSCLLPFAACLSSAGLPCSVTDEVEKALWAKMLYNTTLNPLGAILNLHYGALIENEYSREIMRMLVCETFAVLSACGYSTYWNRAEDYIEELFTKLIPDTYDHRSSTLQDIQKKQKTEIDTLNGCVIRLAQSHQIEVAAHRMIYDLIRSMEANF